MAFNLSVPEISWRAEALGTVSHHPTVGVDTASAGLQTGQDAPVAQAALVRVAVTVRFALVLGTSDRRIAAVAAWAQADGPVVRDAAFGSLSARTRHAGILALSVDAGLLAGAVRVGLAADSAGSEAAQLTSWTLVVRGALEPALALNARLAAAAVVVPRARPRAEPGHALAAVASGVDGAARRSDGAADLRVADRSGRTGALSGVADHLADGAVAAHVRHSARVGAFAVDARLARRALVVVAAPDLAHALQADVAAVAERVAVAHRTAGAVEAARVRQTSLVTVHQKTSTRLSDRTEINRKRSTHFSHPGRHIPPMHF